MIGHIVMWKLKGSAQGKSGAENAAIMKSMLEALPDLIPEIKVLTVSTDIFAANPEADVVLYTVFETMADLHIYQEHPEHKKCVGFILSVVEERRMVDYTF